MTAGDTSANGAGGRLIVTRKQTHCAPEATDVIDPDIYDAVIVGGGMAGLTAAWTLRDRSVLLLEERGRFGGRVYSVSRGEYWLNFGAHLFPPAESIVGTICSDLGLDVVRVPDSIMGIALDTTVLTRGRLESYPLRLPLSWKERAAFVRSGLKLGHAVRQFNRLGRENSRRTDLEARERTLRFFDQISFKEFLGRLPEAVDAIFRCAAHRATAEPEELSAGAGISLFAHVWGGQRALIARNLLGGSALLPQIMSRELGERAISEARVTEVLPTSEEVRITYEHGGAKRRIRAHQVILATPAPVASSLVRGLRSETVQALNAITYGPFLSLAILTREKEPMPWDHVYAVATPRRSFDMFFNHANILRSGPRRVGGSVMIYAGAGLARELLDKTDEEIRSILLADLFSLFPRMSEVLEETIIQRWELGNVFASPGRAALQASLEGPFGSGNLHLAGDYFAELGTMEAAAKSGVEAARKVRKALNGMGLRKMSKESSV